MGRPLGREQLARRWPQEWRQEPRELQLLEPEVGPRPQQLRQARPRQGRLGPLVLRQLQELPVLPQQQLPLVLPERRRPALPEPQPAAGAAQLLRQLRCVYQALHRL